MLTLIAVPAGTTAPVANDNTCPAQVALLPLAVWHAHAESSGTLLVFRAIPATPPTFIVTTFLALTIRNASAGPGHAFVAFLALSTSPPALVLTALFAIAVRQAQALAILADASVAVLFARRAVGFGLYHAARLFVARPVFTGARSTLHWRSSAIQCRPLTIDEALVVLRTCVPVVTADAFVLPVQYAWIRSGFCRVVTPGILAGMLGNALVFSYTLGTSANFIARISFPTRVAIDARMPLGMVLAHVAFACGRVAFRVDAIVLIGVRANLRLTLAHPILTLVVDAARATVIARVFARSRSFTLPMGIALTVNGSIAVSIALGAHRGQGIGAAMGFTEAIFCLGIFAGATQMTWLVTVALVAATATIADTRLALTAFRRVPGGAPQATDIPGSLVRTRPRLGVNSARVEIVLVVPTTVFVFMATQFVNPVVLTPSQHVPTTLARGAERGLVAVPLVSR